MGNLIWWIVVGFVAGVLAKALSPGEHREPQGCIPTILLGVAGSLVMGFLMDLLRIEGSGGMIATIVGATLGAVLLLWLARKYWK
jgi:uncharacterized membrane protein YeaQ/YmgE (transglycosylase-associated protein family)